MSAVARDGGTQVGFIWPQEELFDQIDYASIVTEIDASVIFLTPYASLFADELARRFPERHFVAMGEEASDSQNVTTFRFDWNAAWREAGLIAGEWLRIAPGRDAVLLVDEQISPSGGRPAAFHEGVESTGVSIEVETLEAGSTRQAITETVAKRQSDPEVLVIFMLGAGNADAVEALREESVLFALPGPHLMDDDNQTLLSVRADLPAVLESYLSLPDQRSLLVPAAVETNPRLHKETDESP